MEYVFYQRQNILINFNDSAGPDTTEGFKNDNSNKIRHNTLHDNLSNCLLNGFIYETPRGTTLYFQGILHNITSSMMTG